MLFLGLFLCAFCAAFSMFFRVYLPLKFFPRTRVSGLFLLVLLFRFPFFDEPRLCCGIIFYPNIYFTTSIEKA